MPGYAYFMKDMGKKSYDLTAQTLKIYWRHAKRYPWYLGAIISGTILVELLQTYMPILYRDLIDVLSSSADRNITAAVRIVIFILVVNTFRTGIWRIINFATSFFESRAMADLMNTCYEYLQKHSYGFFSSRFVGSLVTKVKRYERSFETIADQAFFDLGRTLLDTVLILGFLFWQYRFFGYLVLAWVAFYIIFAFIYSRFKLSYDLKRAEADSQTTAQLADSITNNVNVKLFTNYNAENKRFVAVTEKQFMLRLRSWNLGNIGDTIQGFLSVALEFVVVYIAVRFWRNGTLTVGDIVLLQSYLFRMFDKLWNTGRNIRNIYEALADGNEMTEILLKPHEIQDAPGAAQLQVRGGAIEFRKVNFGYYAALPVLKKFDLAIRPGERVALIGPSGGGKSTIAKLLLRFHDLQGGRILIDGQDIAQMTQDSLRSQLALVPQDPILFHRSLMENIRYGRPGAGDKEVIRAAKLAHAHEFITSFPDGYVTLVGERGIKLSGGERQRIAIARAILKDAPILILDEATSSLDSESEMLIQDALKRLMEKRTAIVVAHRLSTIMQMDRIIVIENGKIKEEGKHAELLKVSKGTYQKLWGIQAGGFAVPQ